MRMTYYIGSSFFQIIGIPGELYRFLKMIYRLIRKYESDLSFQEKIVMRKFLDSYPKSLKDEIEGEQNESKR